MGTSAPLEKNARRSSLPLGPGLFPVRIKACLCFSPVHVQAVWQDGLQADALSCPCDPHGLASVLPGQNSFRNIALILRTVMNVQVSHTTIRNWCTRFAPLFQNISIQLIPALNSDEWHTDETVVKIQGKKYYLWLILDSETRFVLGFHLDRHKFIFSTILFAFTLP